MKTLKTLLAIIVLGLLAGCVDDSAENHYLAGEEHGVAAGDHSKTPDTNSAESDRESEPKSESVGGENTGH